MRLIRNIEEEKAFTGIVRFLFKSDFMLRLFYM
jgi:hypothetical protein